MSRSRRQRGSVPIVVALVAMTMVMIAGSSQQLSAVLGLRQTYQTEAMKVAHNANVAGMVVADQVFASRLIYPVVDWNGTWYWSVSPAATNIWTFDASPTTDPYVGTPRMVVSGCNPQRWNNLRQDTIFKTKTPPSPLACASQSRDMNTNIVLTSISNNGFYVPGGNNWINVTTLSSVPLTAAAAANAFPANDSANIKMPAPIPRCSFSLSPLEIVVGQTFTGTMTTSANTLYGYLPNMQNQINYGAPVINNPPNYLNAPVPTASQTYTPPSTGSYSLTAAVDGYDGAATRATCASNSVKVWPVPTCTITINPNPLVIQSSSTVTMTTNSSQTPILSATFNGAPVAASGTSISVSPALLGTYTYSGHVQGVNGSTYDCSATLTVVPQWPACHFTSVNPNPVDYGNGTTLTMSTNGYYGQIVSAKIDGTPVATTGGSKWVVPPVSGLVTYFGSATRNDGAVDTCSAQVNVRPPPVCRFKDPSYHEPVAVPPLGRTVEVGQTFNSTGTPTCNWLCEHQPCSFPGTMDHVIVFADTHSPGYRGDCNQAPHMCIMSYVLAACSVPAADFFIDNIDSAACTASMWYMRPEGGGCYDPQTRLRLADGRWKRADQIRGGDLLFRRDRPPLKVGKVFAGPEKKALYRIAAGGHSLLVTDDHPIATRRGVKQAARVRMDDEVFLVEEGFRPVTEAAPQPVQRGQLVINFETEETSTDDESHLIDAEGFAAGDLNLQRQLKTRKELP